MKTYFQYLGKTLVKRSAIWITFSIYWIYALVILIIVPAITKISPITLWSTDIVSLQAMFVTIMSIVSGMLVVFAFRASIEDETELIIVSKPIKRSKITLSKFLWVLIGAALLAFVTSFISIFTLCFGRYDAVNNVQGMKFEKLPALIGSIWLGTIVVALVFDSFGILVSMVGNKIQILVALVATAIVFSVYNAVSNFILKPLSKSLEDTVGKNLVSKKIIDSKGNVYSYAYTTNQPNNDLYELYTEYNPIGNRAFQYFNFLKQQADLFNSFDVNDLQTNLGSTPFGENASYDTKIRSKDDNLLNYLCNMYNLAKQDNDFVPLVLPFSNYAYRDLDPDFNVDTGFIDIGPITDTLFAMKYGGAKPGSVYVSNTHKLFNFFPSHWLSVEELDLNKEMEQQIFVDIVQPLFENEDTRTITGNFDIVSSEQDKEKWKNQQQLYYDKYFTPIYNILNQWNGKNGISLKDEDSVNDSFAKVQYTIAKQFLQIYWTQIIDQIIDRINNGLEESQKIDIKTYLANEDQCPKFESISGQHSCTSYNYAFELGNRTETDEEFKTLINLKINNPYTGQEVNVGDNFTFLKFTRMLAAFSNVCTFSHKDINAWITNYNDLGWHNLFAGTCAHIQKFDDKYQVTNGWGFDYSTEHYGNSSNVEDAKYNALCGTVIKTDKNALQYGIMNMYRYETTPYVSNRFSVIFWTLISLMLVAIAAFRYQRTDIK